MNGGLPPVVGWSVDYTGTYESAFVVTIFALLVGAIAVVFARTEAKSAT